MATLNGGQFLNEMFAEKPNLGYLLKSIIRAINSLGKQVGAAPVGKFPTPDPIDSINVKGSYSSSTNTVTCNGELLHWTINHNAPISKGIQYITEIATEPNFLQPHIVDHGCSRSGFIHLPTKLDDNATTQTYYMRSYPQHPGSDPQKPTVFGGLSGATKIVMSGSTAATLLNSTGSGTAQNNGQQGGHGLGVVLNRPASSVAKRSVQ